MRSVAPLILLVPVAAALAAVMACEKNNSPPDCRDDACLVANEGGLPPDAGFSNQSDDGAAADPFDAGIIDPQQTCKGLFELCAGNECCSPYGCTNGTCR